MLRPTQYECARRADGVLQAFLPLLAGVDGLHVEEYSVPVAAQFVEQRLHAFCVRSRVAEKDVVACPRHVSAS